MKFKILILLLIVLLIPVFAYAGIGDIIKAQIWSVVVGGIVGALGMLGAGWAIWGRALKELSEFIVAIINALQKDSPGGARVTKEEMTKIVSEGAEVLPAVRKVLKYHKLIK